RAISAGLVGSLLDRVRTRTDQVAALCVAALSRDRHPHGRRAGTTRALALLADARLGLVVCDSRARRDLGRGRRDHADTATGIPGVAAVRGGDDPRPVRLVAL